MDLAPRDVVGIYLSYAPEDAAIVDRLLLHLASWLGPEEVELWHRGLAVVGLDVRAQTEEHLRGARIMIFVVSVDLLASPSAQEEIRFAKKGHDQGLLWVIPVLARHCTWESSWLSGLPALPRGGRPLAQHPKGEEAYVEVSRELRSVAKEARSKMTQPLHVVHSSPERRGEPSRASEQWTHWLDLRPFPARHPQAQAARSILLDAYQNVAVMRQLAKRVPIGLGNWTDQHGYEPAWDSLLFLAADQGKLRELIDVVLADPNTVGYHATLRRACDIE